MVLQLMQLAGSKFQLSITLLEKNIFPKIQSKSFLEQFLVMSLVVYFGNWYTLLSTCNELTFSGLFKCNANTEQILL